MREVNKRWKQFLTKFVEKLVFDQSFKVIILDSENPASCAYICVKAVMDYARRVLYIVNKLYFICWNG